MTDLSNNKALETMKQWVQRSMGWATLFLTVCGLFWHYIVADSMAFQSGLGASSMTHEGVMARDLTVGATCFLIVGSLGFRLLAVAGFRPVYQRTKANNPLWLNRIAYAWWLTAKVLMVVWFFCDTAVLLGCMLSVNDEGRSWN